MPPSVSVAAFVFGVVLILAAIVGKDLKIAAIEMPALKPGTRVVAGIAGIALLYIGLFDPIKPASPAAVPTGQATPTSLPATVEPTVLPSPIVAPSATVPPTQAATPLPTSTTNPTITATINEVKYEHNVTDTEGRDGMRIDVSFVISGAKGIPCQASTYFAFPDGTWLNARSTRYQTPSGYLVTSANFTPGYDVAEYTGNYQLHMFMPYSEFNLKPGKQELKLHVEIYQLGGNLFTTSSALTFEVDSSASEPALQTTSATTPDSAAQQAPVIFSNLRVVYDVTDPGTNQYGMNVFASFTIVGHKGQLCRAVAYFFDADMKPLADTNGQYKTDTSEVATVIDFTPGFDPATYSGANELKLFIPYSELHLTTGSHDLFVSVAIYELPALRSIGQSSTVPFRVIQN